MAVFLTHTLIFRFADAEAASAHVAVLPPGLTAIVAAPDDLTTSILDPLRTYNQLTGEAVTRFASSGVARDRLFAAIVERAETPTAPAPGKSPGPVRNAVPAPSDGRIIHLIATANPKKPGSATHARFALYQDGMTVEDFIAAGGTAADVRWDVAHGFIAV